MTAGIGPSSPPCAPVSLEGLLIENVMLLLKFVCECECECRESRHACSTCKFLCTSPHLLLFTMLYWETNRWTQWEGEGWRTLEWHRQKEEGQTAVFFSFYCNRRHNASVGQKHLRVGCGTKVSSSRWWWDRPGSREGKEENDTVQAVRRSRVKLKAEIWISKNWFRWTELSTEQKVSANDVQMCRN